MPGGGSSGKNVVRANPGQDCRAAGCRPSCVPTGLFHGGPLAVSGAALDAVAAGFGWLLLPTDDTLGGG